MFLTYIEKSIIIYLLHWKFQHMTKKLGIIQSRGLGDILIALPIAKFYHDQGHEIHWPICKEFLSVILPTEHFVNWYWMDTDPQGKFFYDRPVEILNEHGVTEHLCLYQSLSGHPELSSAPWFQIQKFDEYKYTAAGVPFYEKWNLAQCIKRELAGEKLLKLSLVTSEKYYVTHLQGSDWRADPDLSHMPTDWQRIDISEQPGFGLFDWLTILEDAQAIIAIDSVIANMVDQMRIQGPEKYWIPRSHIHLTPVLGSGWNILEPPAGCGAAQIIFSSK